MRRFIAGGLLSSALVLGTTATSGAVPTGGETFTATCGDATVTVQNSPGFGNKAWGSDGTTYHLKSVELRIYRGEFTEEPEAEPLVEFSQSFGNRTGQGEAMECLVVSYNPDHDATAFEYVTVTTRD
jgi:hypothetical protein